MKRLFVTGQQTGLLGGPMYTTYKVLGARYLAEKNNGDALYWLETNDADWNEINHIDYLNASGQLQTLTWNIHSQGFACGYIEIDDSLIELLETFFDSLRQTEFTAELKSMALNCYQKGLTLKQASLKLAKVLYGDLGIHLFTPFDSKFRAFSRDILLKEALRTEVGNQCNAFCLIGKQRKALFRTETGFCLRDGSEINIEAYELLPNVKTRSVCQDAFFHTDTYVAGPGEVKYLSELGPYYSFHGVQPSKVERRMSLLILEPQVQRLLKKYGMTYKEIQTQSKEELLKKVLSEESGFDLKKTLARGLTDTDEYLEKLMGLGFSQEDIKPIQKHLQEEIRKTCGMIRSREKEKHGKKLKDMEYLSDQFLPFGKPQERVFNLFYYMNLYGGKEFIARLYGAYDPDREVMEL